MKTVNLPSGAVLKISLSDFEVAKNLYQTILSEVRENKNQNVVSEEAIIKDIFLLGLSSKKIERCVWSCMERTLYNDLMINKDTFESEKNREDFYPAMMEVLVTNIIPFTKSLSAQFAILTDALKKDLA